MLTKLDFLYQEYVTKTKILAKIVTFEEKSLHIF